MCVHWMERHTRMSKVRASLLNKLKSTITGKCNNSEFNQTQYTEELVVLISPFSRVTSTVIQQVGDEEHVTSRPDNECLDLVLLYRELDWC